MLFQLKTQITCFIFLFGKILLAGKQSKVKPNTIFSNEPIWTEKKKKNASLMPKIKLQLDNWVLQLKLAPPIINWE